MNASLDIRQSIVAAPQLPTTDQAAPTWRATTSPNPIFIVGVSRSGTSLMRRILNASDQIAISLENHFLGHLIASEGARHKFRKLGDLSQDENVQRLVNYIYSGAFAESSRYREISAHWNWIIKKISRDELLRRILASDRTERALFMIMMRVFADTKQRPIMGEKTPAHVRYVPTLVAWFPDGKIIHMLRDPRAIFVSELRRRQKATTAPYQQLQRRPMLFKFYILLQTTVVWFESTYRYERYKNRYPANYCLVKFEDLVTHPEQQIRRVCAFLSVTPQAEMLEQSVVSDGFRLGQDGFDAEAAERWKAHIDPWINAWFMFCFRRQLRTFGYAA